MHNSFQSSPKLLAYYPNISALPQLLYHSVKRQITSRPYTLLLISGVATGVMLGGSSVLMMPSVVALTICNTVVSYIYNDPLLSSELALFGGSIVLNYLERNKIISQEAKEIISTILVTYVICTGAALQPWLKENLPWILENFVSPLVSSIDCAYLARALTVGGLTCLSSNAANMIANWVCPPKENKLIVERDKLEYVIADCRQFCGEKIDFLINAENHYLQKKSGANMEAAITSLTNSFIKLKKRLMTHKCVGFTGKQLDSLIAKVNIEISDLLQELSNMRDDPDYVVEYNHHSSVDQGSDEEQHQGASQSGSRSSIEDDSESTNKVKNFKANLEAIKQKMINISIIPREEIGKFYITLFYNQIIQDIEESRSQGVIQLVYIQQIATLKTKIENTFGQDCSLLTMIPNLSIEDTSQEEITQGFNNFAQLIEKGEFKNQLDQLFLKASNIGKFKTICDYTIFSKPITETFAHWMKYTITNQADLIAQTAFSATFPQAFAAALGGATKYAITWICANGFPALNKKDLISFGGKMLVGSYNNIMYVGDIMNKCFDISKEHGVVGPAIIEVVDTVLQRIKENTANNNYEADIGRARA